MCAIHRTAYYTAYRHVYRQDYQTVYKCCPGWSQLNNEAGCLYRKYRFLHLFCCCFFKTVSAGTEYFLVARMSFCGSAGAKLLQTSRQHWHRPRNERFSEKGQRVKRCFARSDSSADVTSRCHVRRVSVPRGLDVDAGKNS